MGVVLIELRPPLAGGQAAFYELGDGTEGAEITRAPLAESRPESGLEERLADAVALGHDKIIIDLDRLESIDPQGVDLLTSFVWTVRAEDAAPAIVSSNLDVADRVRHAKMDRAFEIYGNLRDALDDLTESGRADRRPESS